MPNYGKDSLLRRLALISDTSGAATQYANERAAQVQNNSIAAQLRATQQAAMDQQQEMLSQLPMDNARFMSNTTPGPGGGSGFEGFVNSIAKQESGGRYNAIGQPVRGDRAYGKYQIMGRNIPGWSRAAIGRAVSPAEFLNSPQIQEAVARYHLSNYYKKYGAAGASAAWYGGEGAVKRMASRSAQTGGPSISGYVNSILSRLR